jgi:hypothetical protein
MSKFIDNARHLPGIIMESDAFFPILSISDHPTGAALWGTGRTGSSKGLDALGAGVGASRDPNYPNGLSAAVFAQGQGSSNSVGAVLRGIHDNGAWVGSEDAAGHFGMYVMHRKGGLDVGNTGDDPLNHVYIGGPLVVEGGCTGCTLIMIMQNSGASDLYPGEVAAMSATGETPKGSSAGSMGNMPMSGADRSSSAYSTAVVGVVGRKWIPADPDAPEGTVAGTGYYDYQATAIAPGDYMGVVTSGAYREIKVSAVGGPIHLGDLLVASDTPGVAMKADPKQAGFGSVIGKAMGTLESGDATIPVLISLK